MEGLQLQPFTQKTIKIIKQIPRGNVMTYGQIATMAGSSRGARQVVRVLHSMSSKHQLPWHRVINSKGEISLRDEESYFTQKKLLEDEGIVFEENGRVDLNTYLFFPNDTLG